MKMRTQVLAIGGRRDEVVIDLGRFDARQPQTPIARNAIELLKQVPQPKRSIPRTAARRVNAVMPHVDTRQHNLAITEIQQAPHFGFDVLWRAAFQPRPNVWDDAVRTAEDAAVLNLDEG